MRYPRKLTAPVFAYALTALAVLFSGLAGAGDCMRLCDADFMRTATAKDIQAEIAKGADIDARDKYGLTPLHGAARYGNAETVTALLKAGANIEARAERGATPLHAAAVRGNAETVTTLLKAGANGKAKTESGYTPFHLAKRNNKLTGTDAYWMLNDARY